MIFSKIAQLAGAEPAADQERLVAANTAFAFDLLGNVARAQSGGNVFISPYSISSALQMVANGAAGETRAEMQRVLKTSGLSPALLNAAIQDLDRQFAGRKDVILNLANGIWYQKGVRLKPAFASDNQKFFQAKLADVDFNSPQSAETINRWADEQTRGKIKDVVQFPFPPLTRLLLANAIYFKGVWVSPFNKHLTEPRAFHLAGGQLKQTPMMTEERDFAYQKTLDFQAVKLPYAGGLQMQLYLPATNSNPALFVANAARNEKWWENIQNGFQQKRGKVILPKFKIEYNINLNGTLEALGMKTAFAGHADFSGIADEPLFISEVTQKSFVDVNEQGTEAAAVTAVTVVALLERMPPPDQFTMILDRPFFFVISDVTTGSILFMGIVNDPTGGG